MNRGEARRLLTILDLVTADARQAYIARSTGSLLKGIYHRAYEAFAYIPE